MLKLRTMFLLIVLLGLLSGLCLPAQAKKKDKAKKPKVVYTGTPVLWRAPADIERRDLFLGPGGSAMRPNLRRVTFVEKQSGGYSTKYRVRDASGNEWIAKLGKEAQSDTAANRLIWAVGYEPEIAYLVPRLTIEGKGTYDNVRLEARPKSVDRTGDWKWKDNPFVGTPEFQGLKIMMTLLNNWDIKDSNNEVLVQRGNPRSPRRYIISDLGATFGKTGGFLRRSRNKPNDYVKSKWIEEVEGNRVDFNYGGKNKGLFENISLEDADWMAAWLTRLSDEQLRDAFRAASYSSVDVNRMARAVRLRINQLANVANNVARNR